MLADDLPCLQKSEWQTREIFCQLERAFAFQAAGGDELERKAGLRDDRLLQPILRADEDDAAARIATHKFLCNGDRRVNVPASPAARNHQCVHARPHPDCCERFKSSPTAIKLAISDDPP